MVTTECTPVNCPVTVIRVDRMEETYVSKVCETRPKQVKHTKIRQVPRVETKRLCKTLWKTNEDGEKVWAGENDCEDVEWMVNDAEEYEAVLDTEETVCFDGPEIPYPTCKETEYTSNQMCMECKVGVTMEVSMN